LIKLTEIGFTLGDRDWEWLVVRGGATLLQGKGPWRLLGEKDAEEHR